MDAYETLMKISDSGNVEIPGHIMKLLPRNKAMNAIILVPDYDKIESEDWKKLTVNEFLSGYSEADGIYDEL
jgi:hypothetical protein